MGRCPPLEIQDAHLHRLFQVLVVRQDLKMSAGKAAAQCARRSSIHTVPSAFFERHLRIGTRMPLPSLTQFELTVCTKVFSPPKRNLSG